MKEFVFINLNLYYFMYLHSTCTFRIFVLFEAVKFNSSQFEEIGHFYLTFEFLLAYSLRNFF